MPRYSSLFSQPTKEGVTLRKPNYSQERMQRERDKAAKAQAKEQKKLEQKDAKLSTTPEEPEQDDTSGRS